MQRAIDAQVRKPTRGATTKHEADGAPGDNAGQAVKVALDAGTNVQMKIQFAWRQPRSRSRQRLAVLLVPQHQRTTCDGGLGLIECLPFP